MTDNVAILMGYTVNVSASAGEYDLNLLIRPNTDTGDCFKAWCCDEQEFISVNGWMFDIEQAGE